MKIAVSGSQSTGKSTLIGAFLARCPQYLDEPEAFEVLADDLAFDPSEGPGTDDLTALLEVTCSVLAEHSSDASVIFERSPVDYLAYAVANASIPDSERARFLATQVPVIREAIRHLDLIVLLPVSCGGLIDVRPGEDESFRERVDEALRAALVEDAHDLFERPEAPLVFELSPSPERWLEQLLQLEQHGTPIQASDRA